MIESFAVALLRNLHPVHPIYKVFLARITLILDFNLIDQLEPSNPTFTLTRARTLVLT